MTVVDHRSAEELQAGLEHILASPKESGRVDMIVRRPRENEREVLEQAELAAGYPSAHWYCNAGDHR